MSFDEIIDWTTVPTEELDPVILPTLELDIDRIKASNEIAAHLEKIITTNDDPVTALDQFLLRMQHFSRKYPEQFITPEGSRVMSMEAILLRAVLYLWFRRPDVPMRHTRQALGILPIAINKITEDSVMHATRGVPDWWPGYQLILFKDINKCFVESSRRRIDATFGYRLIYLACFMTDRISPMNVGNYCLEEAKLLETLCTAVGILDKREKDDHYLSNVIGRILVQHRAKNYDRIMASAAFFLRTVARIFIKEDILLACTAKQGEDEALGLHTKKFIMMNLCKLLVEYMPHQPTMEKILREILTLCPRIELSYKLLRGQKYTAENYHCLPTCLDLAFPTVVDDPNNYRYVCEFKYLRDTLRYIGRKNRTLLQDLLGSLSTRETHQLNIYRNEYEPARELSLPDRETCKFQCVNHRFQAEGSSICPLLGRECLVKRAKESLYV